MFYVVAVSVFRRAAIVVGVLLSILQASTVLAETWAERLGFPADAKVLILHAHDGGLCYEANVAVEKLADAGVLKSASAMAPAPWFADSAAWAKAHPEFDYGIQFTLNSELPKYRWRPLSSREQVPSLVDAEGYFWSSPLQTMVNGVLGDVQVEMEAQFQAAQSAGLNPSHLTTHMGTLFTRHEYAEAYLNFSRRHWIPAVVVELTPARLESFRSQGYPLPDGLVQLIDEYPLPKVDELVIVPRTGSLEETKTEIAAIVEKLAPGLSQIALAPAVPSPALERIDEGWQQRVWDLEVLSSPEFKQSLEKAGVILTDWREIMQRYEGQR